MIDKFLQMIGYSNNYLSQNLDLTEITLFKNIEELKVTFSSETPLDVKEISNFIDVINETKLSNISKINYSFLTKSYSKEDVLNYYPYIISYLSRSSSRLVVASDLVKNYDPLTKVLSLRLPVTDSTLSMCKNEILTLFHKLGFKDLALRFDLVDVDSNIQEEVNKARAQMISQITKDADISGSGEFKMLYENRPITGIVLSLAELPDNEQEFIEFKNKQRKMGFVVSGTIAYIDTDALDKKGQAHIVLSDGQSAIIATKRCKTPDEVNYFSNLEVGMAATILLYPSPASNGDIYINITNMRNSTKKITITKRVDDEPKRRVELHLHTKMSPVDGVSDMSDYCEAATLFKHNAIALTDHGCVQSFHDLYEYTKAHPELKPLYGVELNYVDEDSINIAHEPSDINLDDATYTVFDLETTGISVNYEKIIEISAVKVRHGVTIGQFSELVNPEKNISSTIVGLTGISNADVKNARKIKDVLPDFLKFIEGTILVGHNVDFDMGHLYKNLNNLGISHEKYPYIDTLYLAKVLYPDHKKYALDAVCKFLGVSLDRHHRALSDATATMEIFLHMLLELTNRGIHYHSAINSIIDRKLVFNYPPHPEHIILLAKNHTGIINLYHVLSIAATEYMGEDPIVTKAVIERYHEGILVGSACKNGHFWIEAFDKSDEEMEKDIDFFDYIEVQPPSSFVYYQDHMDNYLYCVTDTIKRIIAMAKKHSVPVCATGDCHQVNPEDQIYRKIIISKDPVGGQRKHYLKMEKNLPCEYYMTTREMLDQFSFLGEKLAQEIVVTNTNLIADACDFVQAFSSTAYPPHDDFLKAVGIPSAEQYLKDTVYNKAHSIYGDLLPGIVLDRIDHEMKSILDNKFSTLYVIASLLVKKSRDDGYIVGSRGSVGSSFVAYLMSITEVNSLPPHFFCPKCHYSAFKMTEEEKKKYSVRPDEENLQGSLNKVTSGFDLEKEKCPICGTIMKGDGHDIPFETFLGVPENPKTPDIDLNFSGENQSQIHEYIRTLFGYTKAFRAGTIQTCKSNIAYATVRDYFTDENQKLVMEGKEPIVHRKAEIEALSYRITGCKRTCSQHPGGIVVVPYDHEIYEVTPVQYPGDSSDKSWMITHFDYHSFEKNLFKLDVLGHDDPTVIRYLMTFVTKHPEEFPFDNALDIPVDDHKVYEMMCDTMSIGVTPGDINSDVATYGISEVGTPFVRGLLSEVRPKTFGELVKVSGISHGTDVWKNNSEDLFLGKDGEKIVFKDLIGCRDDIMVDLNHFGVPSDLSFSTMEFVRKGKPSKQPDVWSKIVESLKPYSVPNWFINSCGKIKYMFPKAHATAYVIMALRIAWFKLYRPIYFYSAILSKKMVAYSADIMTAGIPAIKAELNRLNSIPMNEKKVKDDDLITTLEITLEMWVRGFKIYPVDLYKSEAMDFAVSEDEKALYLPFDAVDGLGLNCAQTIINAREEKPFSTQSDFMKRTSTSKTVFEKMRDMGVFNGMPEDNQITLDLGF